MDLSRRDQPYMSSETDDTQYIQALTGRITTPTQFAQPETSLSGFGPLGGPVPHARSSTDIAVSVAFQTEDMSKEGIIQEIQKLYLSCIVLSSPVAGIASSLTSTPKYL